MVKRKIPNSCVINYLREVIINKARSASFPGIMDKHEIRFLFCSYLRIPKELHLSVLRELEEYGLIEQISRGRAGIKYKILGC